MTSISDATNLNSEVFTDHTCPLEAKQAQNGVEQIQEICHK